MTAVSKHALETGAISLVAFIVATGGEWLASALLNHTLSLPVAYVGETGLVVAILGAAVAYARKVMAETEAGPPVPPAPPA